MYIPPYYKNQDKEAIEQFVVANSFAVLVVNGPSAPLAVHTPLQLKIQPNGAYLLLGHVSKANPIWKHFDGEQQVLAIFSGAHHYISPSWYSHKNVPTWNYTSVHMYGKVSVLSKEQTEMMLREMMGHYEQQFAERPQQFDEIPHKMLQQDLAGVVAFEITVEQVDAANKLSQNRDVQSFENIVTQLEKLDTHEAGNLAAEMKKISAHKNKHHDDTGGPKSS